MCDTYNNLQKEIKIKTDNIEIRQCHLVKITHVSGIALLQCETVECSVRATVHLKVTRGNWTRARRLYEMENII